MKRFSTPPHVKLALIIVMVSIITLLNQTSVFAQQGQKWSTGGNTINAESEFIGVTNEAPLVFKIKNIERMRLSPSGYLGIGIRPLTPLHVAGQIRTNALSGFGTGLTTFDDLGNLTALPFTGNNKQVLLGDGTFGSYVDDDWAIHGINMYTIPEGNVGIGTDHPEEKLDVAGNANIRGTLYVEEGVIIGKRISGQRISSDSLDVAELIKSKELELEKEIKIAGITIDGPNSSIFANTGSINFQNTNLVTSGNLTAGTFTANNMNIVNTNIQNLTVSDAIVTQKIQANIIYADNIEVNHSSFSNLSVLNEMRVGGNTMILKSALNADQQVENRFYTESGNLLIQDGENGFHSLLNPLSGNVGIGTTDPIEKLDVNGNANIRGTLYVQDGVIIGQRVNSEIIESEEIISERAELEELDVELEIRAGRINTGDLDLENLRVGNFLNIDGINSKISSESGTISFDDDNITTTGSISAESMNVTNANYETLQVAEELRIGTNTLILSSSQGESGSENSIYTETGDLKIQSEVNNNYNTIINYNNEGKVGIGTNNPQKKLHLKTFIPATTAGGGGLDGEGREYGGTIRIENEVEDGTTSIWDLEPIANANAIFPNKFRIGTPDNPVITLVENGKVGIGTIDPSAKLHVAGNVKIDDLPDLSNTESRMLVADDNGNIGVKDIEGTCNVMTCENDKAIFNTGIKKIIIGRLPSESPMWSNSYIGFNAKYNEQLSWDVESDGANNGAGLIYSTIGGDLKFATMTSTSSVGTGGSNQTFSNQQILNDNTHFIITRSGNIQLVKDGNTLTFSAANGGAPTGPPPSVEIGSSNGVISFYSNGNYNKLVCKSIWTKEEVVVQATNPWPDYVFEENYKLKSLSELESFIKENKHLPNIPNKDEIAEDGIKLGEMNTKLLQKVEELTLYIIELEKRINTLEEK
ncbi:MAG: hypothetical protein A2236_02120 [Bacteroidetes bacterium RIFOXYA2_FULL_33_7]|nr:MAG: hypothetical protein A2236_02120 [Bacteroidetes bacterium RIFOXYA2_FULL_33_7]